MATDLVANAIANLKSLYEDEREMMQFVSQEKEKLESNLSAMVGVLEDAEQKQLKGTWMTGWLNKLENAMYVLEDILDDCFTEAMRDKYEGDRSCSFLSFLHPDKIMFRHNISARMKAIREKLQIISQEKSPFNLAPSAHHFSTTDLGQSSANVTHNIHKERLTSSKLWNILDGNDIIFGPLKLSYLNLPLEYRRCFCYCAVFPKDYEIEKVDIIQLWMANGFIHSRGMVDMEDMGNDIVMELEWRSLIEVVEKDEYGVIERFKIHDLVYDLAHFVTGDDICVADETSSKDLQTRIFHVSIFSKLEDSRAKMLALHVKGMRSYINHSMSPAWIGDNLSEYTSLRALDFRYSNFNKFWSSNGPSGFLKHLRYLNLSRTEIEELPKFICSLWNLQTLKLEWCHKLKSLPEGLGRLKNLRHIHNKGCSRLSSISRSIGLLTSLRTLSEVIVNSSFQLSSLGSLKCIRGKMKIRHLERVREVKDAQEANLMEKCDLTQLALEWEGNNDKDEQLQVKILEALRPSPKLKYLKLIGYKGAVFPQWMMKDISSSDVPILNSLEKLAIVWCKSLKYFPNLKDLKELKVEHCSELVDISNIIYLLPSLQRLSIVYTAITNLGCSTTGLTGLQQDSPHRLPVLRYLYLSGCKNLEALPEWLGDAMFLETISIFWCSKLESIPNSFQGLTNLKELWIGGCPELSRRCRKETGEDWYKIKHVPVIKLDGYVDYWNE